MSQIAVYTPDHPEIFERISGAIQLTDSRLAQILQRASGLIERAMKERTPIGQTGLTNASIETRKEADLTYGIGSYTRGNILRFLDRGTGIYRHGHIIFITPTTRRVLHFWSKETGDEVFAAYCIVKGIIPMEILTQSIHIHLDEIDQMMKQEIRI